MYLTFANPPAGGISLSKSPSADVLPQTWRDDIGAHALPIRFRRHCRIRKSDSLSAIQNSCNRSESGYWRLRKLGRTGSEILFLARSRRMMVKRLRVTRMTTSFSGNTIGNIRSLLVSGTRDTHPGRTDVSCGHGQSTGHVLEPTCPHLSAQVSRPGMVVDR